MIKINLLPVKKRKKAKPVPSFLIAGVLLLALAIIVSLSYSYILKSKINNLEVQKAENAKKLAELNERIKEVQDFEKLNQKFKQRKEIIEKLTKNQSMPVKVLDEMSNRLVDGVWLRAMTISRDSISVDGVGFTNSDIVNFVQTLKESELFKNVVLLETRQGKLEGEEVYLFKLTLKVAA
jgi:type IV pilus assembly protein PilN